MLKPAPYSINEKKKVRVIVDTDCYCEADDQFALAHHLMTPKIDVVGITAAHYADRWGPGSEEASFEEIHHVLDLMGYRMNTRFFTARRPRSRTKRRRLTATLRALSSRRRLEKIRGRSLSRCRVR